MAFHVHFKIVYVRLSMWFYSIWFHIFSGILPFCLFAWIVKSLNVYERKICCSKYIMFGPQFFIYWAYVVMKCRKLNLSLLQQYARKMAKKRKIFINKNKLICIHVLSLKLFLQILLNFVWFSSDLFAFSNERKHSLMKKRNILFACSWNINKYQHISNIETWAHIQFDIKKNRWE